MGENRIFNGYALRAVREAAGRSVPQCAGASNISTATWEYLESGFVPVSEAHFERVCAHLKVPDQTFAVVLPESPPMTRDEMRSALLPNLVAGILEAAARIGLDVEHSRVLSAAESTADALLVDL